jgi:predicted nucleic acid-binding protein
MKVLVDTSVWSLALRRRERGEIARKLTNLILSSLVVMIGPVRQELLSGISSEDTFLELKAHLGQFDDLPITTEDYETAAGFFNTCRQHGLTGSHIDFLICAVAHNKNLLIFTTDKDFVKYAEYVPVNLLAQA